MKTKKESNIRTGKIIKELRKQDSYTQEELSEILSISVNHLSAIERGASGASMDILQKLMDLFGVSAEYLLFGESENSSELNQIIRKIKRLPTDQLKYVDGFLKILTDINQQNSTKK